jgi:hypothetical protein
LTKTAKGGGPNEQSGNFSLPGLKKQYHFCKNGAKNCDCQNRAIARKSRVALL